MSTPVLRCKLRVSEVVQSMNSEGQPEQERVTLQAVYSGSDENKAWSAATPWAEFKVSISNKTAFGTLYKGGEFYVDFTPAPKPVEGQK